MIVSPLPEQPLGVYPSGMQTLHGKALVACGQQWFDAAMLDMDHEIVDRARLCLTEPTSVNTRVRHLFAALPKYFADIHENDAPLLPVLMFGNLLCWGLRQPWGHTCTVESLIAPWRSLLFVQANKSHTKAAALFADFVLPLDAAGENVLSMRQRKKMHMRLFNTIDALVPWEQLSSYQTNYTYPTLFILGHLCSMNGKGFSDRWLEKMRLGLRSMDDEDKRDWLLALLASPLEQGTKLAAAQQLPPLVWLHDFMPVAMSTILSADEASRFAQLHWSINAETNKSLCNVYCPNITAYLGTAMPELDWASPGSALALVQSLKSKNSRGATLALPENFFEA